MKLVSVGAPGRRTRYPHSRRRRTGLVSPMTQTEFNPDALRRAYALFPSGVTAICGLGEDDLPIGMTASSFTSVSLSPALVSVCVNHTSSTWPRLAQLPRLGLSVLASSHAQAARSLAGKGDERFSGVNWHSTTTGAIFIAGAPLWLECAVERTHAAGDHDIVVLRVTHLTADELPEPLVFHRSNLHPWERS